MTPPRGFSPAAYVFPLPHGHRFPQYKYAGVAERLRSRLAVVDTPGLDWALAEEVHDPGWLRRWRAGDVTRDEIRNFGLPWSPEVVERSRRAAGGTLAALDDAWTYGWGINLAG